MSGDALGWYDRAACRDLDADLFDYDPDLDPQTKADTAKQVCAGCQVRDACLDFALAQSAAEDTTGVYGGLTPAERLARRAPTVRPPRSLVRHPQFARVSFELASQIGTLRAAEHLGVADRTLQRAWRRHGLPAHPPERAPQVAAAERLSAEALRRLGWSAPRRRGPLSQDPQFAADAFQLARRVGVYKASQQLGVTKPTLYRAWERNGLGRPVPPLSWTQRFARDRTLVEQAFRLARDTSILAAASTFQTTSPTLRRAFTRHGLGHPHAGLDLRELQRRWNERPGPDHRNRAQRRDYRARRAAERRAAPQRTAASHGRADRRAPTSGRDYARRSRPHPPEERER
jgi:WhiB family redox-sensing transcriptional regulator